MTSTAEHLRESILAVLASSETPLSSAQIYDRVESAESKQLLYAQINYLKKTGCIASGMSEDGTAMHSLTALPPAVLAQDAEIEADHSQPVSPTLELPDADLHRIVWSQPHGNATRFLTLTVNDDQPRLNTSGAFAVDPALLRQMADLIDVLQQRVAA
ncbi:MAG: hypothetical protein MZV65_31830 [Chromatiales bacterium]|nr:hypothetical protein [Chromatiales bacterium]